MDAVPIMMSQQFGAWADALTRDRWRLNKVEERIRNVVIGGTAIGTGIGAPKGVHIEDRRSVAECIECQDRKAQFDRCNSKFGHVC